MTTPRPRCGGTKVHHTTSGSWVCPGCEDCQPEKPRECKECFGTGKMLLSSKNIDILVEERKKGLPENLACRSCSKAKDNRPEAVLDRVLQKAGVVPEPKEDVCGRCGKEECNQNPYCARCFEDGERTFCHGHPSDTKTEEKIPFKNHCELCPTPDGQVCSVEVCRKAHDEDSHQTSEGKCGRCQNTGYKPDGSPCNRRVACQSFRPSTEPEKKCYCSKELPMPCEYCFQQRKPNPHFPAPSWQERFRKEFPVLQDLFLNRKRPAVEASITDLLQRERDAARAEGYIAGSQKEYDIAKEDMEQERAASLAMLRRVRDEIISHSILHPWRPLGVFKGDSWEISKKNLKEIFDKALVDSEIAKGEGK